MNFTVDAVNCPFEIFDAVFALIVAVFFLFRFRKFL